MTSKAVYKPIFIVSVMFFLQVNSGSETLSYYMLEILDEMELTMDEYLNACLVQSAFTLGYLFATPLLTRLRRKVQFTASTATFALCMATLGSCLIVGKSENTFVSSLMSVLPYVAFIGGAFAFGLGLGPITFGMVGEIFPPRAKAIGASMVLAVRYMSSFLILKLFPTIKEWLTLAGAFYLGACVCVVAIAFVWCFLPETQGLTLTQLATLFEDNQEDRLDDYSDDSRSENSRKESSLPA